VNGGADATRPSRTAPSGSPNVVVCGRPDDTSTSTSITKASRREACRSGPARAWLPACRAARDAATLPQEYRGSIASARALATGACIGEEPGCSLGSSTGGWKIAAKLRRAPGPRSARRREDLADFVDCSAFAAPRPRPLCRRAAP
jgi:hypothetical protein